MNALLFYRCCTKANRANLKVLIYEIKPRAISISMNLATNILQWLKYDEQNRHTISTSCTWNVVVVPWRDSYADLSIKTRTTKWVVCICTPQCNRWFAWISHPTQAAYSEFNGSSLRERKKKLVRIGVFAFCKRKKKTKKNYIQCEDPTYDEHLFFPFRLNPRDYVTLHSLVMVGFF